MGGGCTSGNIKELNIKNLYDNSNKTDNYYKFLYNSLFNFLNLY